MTKSEAISAVLAGALVFGAHAFAAGAGTLTVTTASASPDYQVAYSGQVGGVGGIYEFHASGETIALNTVSLTLTHGSPQDIVKASLYNGDTLVGETTFSSANANATLNGVIIPQDRDLDLTLKIDYATVGKGTNLTHSGDLVVINVATAQGTGQTSGTTITASGSTNVTGARLMKSIPVFTLDNLPSGNLQNGVLMRFKVTASAGGSVGITNLALKEHIVGTPMTNLTIYGFSDAKYTKPIKGVQPSGDLQGTDDCQTDCPSGLNYYPVEIMDASGAPTILEIPSGETRYFEVRANVGDLQRDASVTTIVPGDANVPPAMAAVSQSQNTLVTADAIPTNSQVWSPNTLKNSARTDKDWTNGYGVLPLSTFFQTLHAQN
jgi:hypothetical protein